MGSRAVVVTAASDAIPGLSLLLSVFLVVPFFLYIVLDVLHDLRADSPSASQSPPNASNRHRR